MAGQHLQLQWLVHLLKLKRPLLVLLLELQRGLLRRRLLTGPTAGRRGQLLLLGRGQLLQLLQLELQLELLLL